MDILNVKVKKMHEKAVIPTFGSEWAAGADLYACLRGADAVTIPAHRTVMIGTGIAVAIPCGYWGGVYARSGLATKQSLRPANCTGVIDSDYRGEVIVALHNDSNEPGVVNHGDRVGQLVITPVPAVVYEEAETLDDTKRGAGGFGHTGV